MARGTSAHDVQHLFYAGATDPRIFQTGKVVPRKMTQNQEFGQSGSRYASESVVNSEWSEVSLDGGLDLGDMVLLLASLFSSKREANGDWKFLALAGARAAGYDAPKVWNKLQSYNWADSGPSYEAADAVLQQLELSYDRSAETMMTAAFAGKQYKRITRPTAAPVPKAVDAQIVANADIRLGLSAGRLGEVVYPTELLRTRWSYPSIVELVYGGNQSDRGWTHYVEADIDGGFRPLLTFTFMANDTYLDFIPRDGRVFCTLGDAAGRFEWIHLARWTEQPSGPGAQRNVQSVEIGLLPVARVDARALVDLELSFTAATSGQLTGVRASGTAIGSDLQVKSNTNGYKPAGLTEVLYDAATDKLIVGTVDTDNEEWPENWEPESIQIGNGTVYPLEYVAATKKFQSVADITAAPITTGAREATIKWKWTPAHFMSGKITGTGVAAL